MLTRVTHVGVLLRYRHLSALQLAHSLELTLAPCLIPPGLRSLRLPEQYNQPLPPNVLPATLRHLVMGGLNQQLEPGCLPSQLTHLSLDAYNQPLSEGVLPASLCYLCLGYAFNQPISPGVLPAELSCLILGVDWAVNSGLWDDTRDRFLSAYSDGSLMFEREFRGQPSHLVGMIGWHVQSRFDQPLPVGALPAALRHLTLPASFGYPLDAGALPSSLESLLFESEVYEHDLWSAFHYRLSSGVLPDALQRLCLPGDYD